MSKTTTQLATSVLQHLAVLDATETIDSTDETYVTGVYEDKWTELSSHGNEVTYWPMDVIPNAVFLALRDLIALYVRGAFGMPISERELRIEEDQCMRRLRRHTAVQSSDLPTETRNF